MISTEELERLAASITPGPWGHFMGDICAELHGDDTLICGMNKSCGARSSEYFSYKANNPTAQANAHAITLVPDLLAEVIALRAEVDRLGNIRKNLSDMAMLHLKERNADFARATAAEADAERLAEALHNAHAGGLPDVIRMSVIDALAAHTQRVNAKEGE